MSYSNLLFERTSHEERDQLEVPDLLPIVATLSLAAGLLMPIRDGREGRRATIPGNEPLRARFRIPDASPAAAAVHPSEAILPDAARSPECERLAPVAVAIPEGTPSLTEPADVACGESDPPGLAPRPALDEADEALARPLPSRGDDARPLHQPASAVPIRFPIAAQPYVPTSLEAGARDLCTDSEPEEPVTETQSNTGLVPSDSADVVPTVGFFTRLRGLLGLGRAADARGEATPDRPAAATGPEPPEDRLGDPERFARLLAGVENSPAVEPDVDDSGDPGSPASAFEPVAVERIIRDEAPPATISPIVVERTDTRERARLEPRRRSIPLTRLPLRPIGTSVTWTTFLEPPEADLEPEARLALVRSCLSGAVAIHREALRLVWFEERGESRSLALQFLARAPEGAACDVFVDALRTGSEEQRATAIDALAVLGERGEIAVALADPLDEIVARASLALCASRSLADHRNLLDRHVGPKRSEAILGLLAGVLE